MTQASDRLHLLYEVSQKLATFQDLDEARNAYDQGRCDAWTNDRSALAARGLQLKNRDAHVILPEIISKEPIGPIVRQNDSQWAHVVRWTFFAMFRDGLIFRGNRLVNWDCALQTAVADDELYKQAVQGRFWYLRYPVVGAKAGGQRERTKVIGHA